MDKEKEVIKNEHELKHLVDDATGEIIEVTDNMRQWGLKIHNYMEADAIEKAFIWSVFRAQKLYLVFGCGSMKQYIRDISVHSESTIYDYLSIGNSFFPAFNELKTPTVGVEDDPEEFLKELQGDPELAELGKLGRRKLREISKQGNNKIRQLVTQKQITFDDGTTMNFDEILALKAQEFEDEARERNKKKDQIIANLQEDKNKLASEKQTYENKLKQEKAENERLKHLEQFSKTAVSVDQLYEGIDKTISYMRQAQKAFGPLDTLKMKNDEVPPGLKEEIMNLVRLLNSMQTTAYDRFPFMREEIGEVGVLPTWLLKDPEEFGKLPEDEDAVSAVKEIRTDTQRMAIKYKSNGERSHGWSNLENGFETEEQMQNRYAELLESGKYVEG